MDQLVFIKIWGKNPKKKPVCKICLKPFIPKTRTAFRLLKTCSYRCRDILRAKNGMHEHLRSIAHKGRSGWTAGYLESHRQKMSGPRNPSWKGGVTYKRNKGNYIGPKYVRCPPQFILMSRRDGYVMEHRVIVAEMVGRPLDRTEVVHHRDHNTRNNAVQNLELWPDNRTHKLAEHGRSVLGAVNRWSPPCPVSASRPTRSTPRSCRESRSASSRRG